MLQDWSLLVDHMYETALQHFKELVVKTALRHGQGYCW